MGLEKEIKTYEEKLPELLAHEGKFVLIHGDDVIGHFDSYAEALRWLAASEWLVESLHDFRAFRPSQNSRPRERTCEGLGASHVRIEQPPVEVERVREPLEDFRGPGLEASAPELHFFAFCFAAKART